jgi:predicted nucleic acid-binding Zn ribbon protein
MDTTRDVTQAYREMMAQKQQKCAQEVAEVLQRNGCALRGRPVYTEDGRTVVQIDIIITES